MVFKSKGAAVVPLRKSQADPARLALAAAIEEAERAKDMALSRLEQAEAGLSDATAALKAATAAVDAAEAARVEAALEHGWSTPDSGLREAMRHRDDMIEGERIARAARDRVVGSLPELDAELAAAKQAVESAARAVMIGAAPGLMAKAERIYSELQEVRCALAFVHSCFGWPPSDASRRVQSISERLVELPDHRTCAAWRQAFTELQVNAIARLPE
jgi:hypothetical protein